MKQARFLLAIMFCGAGCWAQNNNNNVNNNTVIINSQPVIKETVVKERTKVVYKEKPAPKPPSRVARKLGAPVQLQGYLWVYPEDLGYYSSEPVSVISNINRQGKYGRDDWRVPTEEEIQLMRNEADKAGLGPLDSYAYFYSYRFRSGTLRLVSTGKSITERRNIQAQTEAAERKRRSEAAAAERRRAEQAAAAERQRAAAQKAAEEQERRNLAKTQSQLLNSGQAYVIENVLWNNKNYDSHNCYDAGRFVNVNELPKGWRLPTFQEFRKLIYKCSRNGSNYVYGDLVIPEGTYLVTDNGQIKIYNLKMDVVFTDNKGLIRAVQDVVK